MLQIRLNVSKSGATPAKIIAKQSNFPDWVQEKFAAYMAKELRNQFKDAITKQRFKSTWPPLSIPYRDWKGDHNLSLNIWEATGYLKKSIVYRKRNGYYLVGIDPYKKYKDGPKVLYVAQCIEYGTSRMPARPLFRPIFNQVRKNIRRYWVKFLREENIDPEEFE